MTDPIAISDALLAIAAAITVNVGGSVALTLPHLGAQSIPASPTAEVFLGRATLSGRGGGGIELLRERHRHRVRFLEQVHIDSDRDERIVGAFVLAFVNTVHGAGFDTSLGGLVNVTRCVDVSYGAEPRLDRDYRVGEVIVETEVY